MSQCSAIIVKRTKKDFAIAKVGESAARGQMLQLSKEFESTNKFFQSA